MPLEFPPGTEETDLKEPKQSEPQKPTDEQVKLFFQAAFSQADQARKPREHVWRTAWDLYNGEIDWSGKAQWQSKINIPKVRDTVDRAAATFRRALVRMKRFYSVESETKLGIDKGLFTMSLIDFWLDQANFVNEFTNGLKSGLITSTTVFKIWWQWGVNRELAMVEKGYKERRVVMGLPMGTQTVTELVPERKNQTTGALGFKAVDPFKFWVVPGTDNKCVIEKSETTVANLDELAKQGIYKRDAVDEVINSVRKEFESKRDENARKGEQTPPANTYIQPIDLYHYWGDIYGDDGRILMRDATFTMAGKDIVLRPPRVNPFFHNRPPYVFGSPYIVPFSTYNRGIVEDVMGIAQMITELANLVIDGAQFEAAKAFSVDVSQLYDAEDTRKGIYPGVVLRKDGEKSVGQRQLVEAIDTGSIPASVGQVLSFLDRELQISTAVTELISGDPGRAGSRTATEISTKTAQALEGLDDAARTVEETVINPALDLITKTIYQFHADYTMPRLVENFPRTAMNLQDLTPEERYINMVQGFHFKARGISIMLDKAHSMGKISEFLQILSHIPGMLPRLNIDAVLEEIMMALGLNPQKLLVNPEVQPMLPMAQGPGAAQAAMDPTQLTPAQMMAGQQGAELGGATNNPMAPAPNPQMNPDPTAMIAQLLGGSQ